ncbi:MAG TPA: hypothetical protein VL309_07675 [Vicinamibacterales bacterium]|jgi:hypothetical protein|nr:hypothetical protein [Vicinamibacterales bacterium]
MLSDQELRALVREAIARVGADPDPSRAPGADPAFRLHASHARFVVVPSADADGACLIEPAVRCNHCGYCLSYGH